MGLTDQLKQNEGSSYCIPLCPCFFAEPEAEADAQWYGYNWNNGYYPMSYGWNRWNNFNRYNMYNRNFWGYRRYAREAEAEAEPEAESDAQWYNYYNRGYGYYPYSMNYGYSGYPYNRYNNYMSYNRYNNYNRYNMYNRNFWGNRR